jgi:hypothetical protein
MYVTIILESPASNTTVLSTLTSLWIVPLMLYSNNRITSVFDVPVLTHLISRYKGSSASITGKLVIFLL